MTKRVILGRFPHLSVLIILIIFIHRHIPSFLFILNILYILRIDEFLFLVTAFELIVVFWVLFVCGHGACVGGYGK